jgi:uncharacterized membrane protein YecN with MAPEG domain
MAPRPSDSWKLAQCWLARATMTGSSSVARRWNTIGTMEPQQAANFRGDGLKLQNLRAHLMPRGGHMQSYYDVGIVTLLTCLACSGMAVQVSRTRSKLGIFAPVMTGDAVLERTIRAHLNTVEWMPIFLPSLWLFAIYWSSLGAAVLGLVWIVGRIIYFVGYVASPSGRFPGFFIQAMAVLALLLGALGRIIYLAATDGLS